VGCYIKCEGEAGVREAEARQGGTLVRVEQTFGPGDGGKSDCNYPSRIVEIDLRRTMIQKKAGES